MIDISILLPTKDRPVLLERSLEAILAQEGPTFEIILDNGGAPVAFADPRIVVVNRPAHMWGGANYNRAASYARGRLMHIAADDDVMLPGTLADAVSMDAEWCYGSIQFVDDGVLSDVYVPGEWSEADMEYVNYVPLPSVFWTRELFDKAGGFDETLRFAADYEMWSRFGTRSLPQRREHVSYLYSRWPGSVSSQYGNEIVDEVARLHERWAEIGFGNR